MSIVEKQRHARRLAEVLWEYVPDDRIQDFMKSLEEIRCSIPQRELLTLIAVEIEDIDHREKAVNVKDPS